MTRAFNMFNMSARGYTLVELIVVLGIIGIISALIIPNMGTARAKSRDERRLADLVTLEAALKTYYLANGEYPSTSNTWWGACPSTEGWLQGGKALSGENAYIPDLAPRYIAELPTDPRSSDNQCYLYNSDGDNYILIARMTVETYTQADNPRPQPAYDGATGDGCPSDGGYQNTFAVYSIGARCW